MTDSPRLRSRLPHWGWFLLATLALVISAVGLSIWLPYHREQQMIQKIESWGGETETETRGPDWLRELVGEDQMKKCKVFERVSIVILAGTPITDTEVADLSSLTNLGCLYLSGSAVTDAVLAKVSELPNLEILDVSDTPVTDSGLAYIKTMTRLNFLYLDSTAVTDTGLTQLSGLTNLEHLSLKDTAVTEKGLTHLIGLTNLQDLSINDTALSAKGIEKLQKALPKCKILH